MNKPFNYETFRAEFVAKKKARLVAEEALYPETEESNTPRPTERAAFALHKVRTEGVAGALSIVERRLLYYDKEWIKTQRCTCGSKPKPQYHVKAGGRLERVMKPDTSACVCMDVYTPPRLMWLSNMALIPEYQILPMLEVISATFAKAEMLGQNVEYEYAPARVYVVRKVRERKVA